MSDDDAFIKVPRHPSLDYFSMVARKGVLLDRQLSWTYDEIAAGRMTSAQQLVYLHSLWDTTVLVPTELPPLPEK